MMKKSVSIAIGTLVVLAVAYAAYVGWLVNRSPNLLWLYGCHPNGEMQQVEQRFPNVTMDIHIAPDGTVTPQDRQQHACPDQFTPILQHLSSHPYRHMLMHASNLCDSNQQVYKYMLDSLTYIHNVQRRQVMIESERWQSLFAFTRDHYLTVYRLDAPRPSSLSRAQRDSILTRTNIVARSGCVRGISMPTYWYNSLRRQFRDQDIFLIVHAPQRSRWTMLADPLGQVIWHDERVMAITVGH